MVQFGKVWEINTLEDAITALKMLDDAQFIAEMADDFGAWQRETDEIRRQRMQIMETGIEKGFIIVR